MMNWENAGTILGICAIVLIIGFAKQLTGWLVTVIIRGTAGGLGIYLLNMLLPLAGVTLHLGINLFNMLIVGILGLPGLGLLYAIVSIDIF